MAVGPRKPGEFCWINMLTPEPAKACDFYAKLLGWTYQELPGMGYIVKVDGQEFGGMWDLNSPQTPPGTPPHIGVMVKVDSADAMAKKIESLGGKAMAPFDVMDSGRMAVCHDPVGAAFDIWEGKKSGGATADPTRHGVPSWNETITTDVARASKFYQDLFGWTAESMPMPDFTYTSFKLDGNYVAGMMPLLPHMGKVPAHWGVYITVDDVDATVAQAPTLGGSIAIPAMDIPNVGRFAGVVSPQGVMFYVITYVMPAA